MPTTLLGGAAALLLVLAWALRRRTPPPLLRTTDTGAIAALNRAQIALVRADAVPQPRAGSAPEPPAAGSAPAALPLPSGPRRQGALGARLQRQLSGDSRQRLQAMQTARRWGHPAALPVLRRGLRDVDPAVVREAVRGIERFRVCPCSAARRPQPPLPRNVSRRR